MLNIPVLNVKGNTIPEAYEQALLALSQNGISIKTEYDKETDRPSLDATMNITIENPHKDPMIHKAFPGGIEDLAEYYLELLGYKNKWQRSINNPEDKRWAYTYNDRLENYGLIYNGKKKRKRTSIYKFSLDENPENEIQINQCEYVVNTLIKTPFSRRAQMITWMPTIDPFIEDGPCLQSLWFRLTEDIDGYVFNTNIRFRSNDAFGAFFMNCFGLNKMIEDLILIPLTHHFDKPIAFGRMNWQADSFHVYGKDMKNFEACINKIKTTKFEDRVYNFYEPDIQEIWKDGINLTNEKIKKMEI